MAYLSKEKIKKLHDQLNELKTVKRQEVAQKLRSAREEGDISENAAYDEAKEAQSILEGQIIELEKMLKDAIPMTMSSNSGIVTLGSTVTVITQNGEAVDYSIVSRNETKPEEKKISNESPLGRALLGKKAGDTIEFTNPKGVIITYKVKVVH